MGHLTWHTNKLGQLLQQVASHMKLPDTKMFCTRISIPSIIQYNFPNHILGMYSIQRRPINHSLSLYIYIYLQSQELRAIKHQLVVQAKEMKIESFFRNTKMDLNFSIPEPRSILHALYFARHLFCFYTFLFLQLGLKILKKIEES